MLLLVSYDKLPDLGAMHATLLDYRLVLENLPWHRVKPCRDVRQGLTLAPTTYAAQLFEGNRSEDGSRILRVGKAKSACECTTGL
jgi:hypothetical protein